MQLAMKTVSYRNVTGRLFVHVIRTRTTPNFQILYLQFGYGCLRPTFLGFAQLRFCSTNAHDSSLFISSKKVHFSTYAAIAQNLC